MLGTLVRFWVGGETCFVGKAGVGLVGQVGEGFAEWVR